MSKQIFLVITNITMLPTAQRFITTVWLNRLEQIIDYTNGHVHRVWVYSSKLFGVCNHVWVWICLKCQKCSLKCESALSVKSASLECEL